MQVNGQAPEPQQVRVAGKLGSVRWRERSFELVLPSGEVLAGMAEEMDPQAVGDLLGKHVVVSGLAYFRPSGRVDYLEVEWIEAAQGDVSVWARMPRPLRLPLDPHRLRKPQEPASGVSSVLGKWPGTESDEEVFAALEALS